MRQFDIFIIGGGINGCGIARDAAGRGLTTGVAEMGDLAQGTSSASTKLIHGGLRYLEQYEFGMVRDALREREVLMRIASHIVRPMRFVLPQAPGMRPAWLLRLGLFLYDHLAGRKRLPRSRSLDLVRDAAGAPLKESYQAGFEYSDCWVDDARLVVLNAQDAARRGAEIMTRTQVTSACRRDRRWIVSLKKPDGQRETIGAAMLVNATGPWADIAGARLGPAEAPRRIRLVRGSHIVLPKLYDHDRAYIFQNPDGRIAFAIPYEHDFTLVGTTDRDHTGDPADAVASPAEVDYLVAAMNRYFRQAVEARAVVSTFAGVRALVDDGSGKAQRASRDYRLDLQQPENEAPLLTVLGGKITSYRTLAESALARLALACPDEPRLKAPGWTASQALPGSELSGEDLTRLGTELKSRYKWLTDALLCRWLRSYGSETQALCEQIEKAGRGSRPGSGLGRHFGAGLYEAETRMLMEHEWAMTPEDILWRRTKLGLHLEQFEIEQFAGWMDRQTGNAPG